MLKLKHPVLLVLTVFFSFIYPIYANGLNPTIINGDLMLCPMTGETLMTQEYDTYQWYKDGEAIPGATGQTHYIYYYDDIGSAFSVYVTLGAESAMSPAVFADGHVFLPLVVLVYGEGFWITYENDEEYYHMCSYHDLFLDIMMPFDTNIQWYKNGDPIEGANNTIYRVSETGIYWASGSPGLCPNLVEFSGIFDVTVYDPETPVITQSSDTLFTSVMPGQWYSGSNPIPGATGQFLVPGTSGFYSFLHIDQQGCEAHSEEYYYEWEPLGSDKVLPGSDPNIQVSGNHIRISNASGWSYQIISITGNVVQEGLVNDKSLSVSHLSKGFYLIRLVNADRIAVMKFVRN